MTKYLILTPLLITMLVTLAIGSGLNAGAAPAALRCLTVVARQGGAQPMRWIGASCSLPSR